MPKPPAIQLPDFAEHIHFGRALGPVNKPGDDPRIRLATPPQALPQAAWQSASGLPIPVVQAMPVEGITTSPPAVYANAFLPPV